MASKKKIKQQYTEIPINNIKYNHSLYRYGIYDYGYADLVNHDSDSVYDSNNNKTIVNGRITAIKTYNLYKLITGRHSIKSINDYCLDRFIKKSFTKDAVIFITTSGYYGDEADFNISNDFSKNLNEFIQKLNSQENNSKLIEEILILEYGYVLNELKNREWFFEKISLNLINPAAGMKHVQKNVVDDYKQEVSDYKYNLTCLCQTLSQGKAYRLIDGYHRFSTANQLYLEKIDAVVCR